MFWRSKTDGEKIDVTAGQNAVKAVKNWYSERYDRVIVQRNIFFLLLIFCLVLVLIAILAVSRISTSKSFEPFVIQIEENTGVAKVVNPVSSDILSGNEALNQYFIKRYLIARETYNPVDFDTQARQIVRLFSSSAVFWQYLGLLRDDTKNPQAKYGDRNTTYLRIKSWSKLDGDGKKYMVRFSVHEVSGPRNVYNKLAIIEVNYFPMSLKDEDRDINPVGFQVTGYRVDDDNS
jgi:type IV secretion system protein VirB8